MRGCFRSASLILQSSLLLPLEDLRHADGVKHLLASMVQQRIYGALADYEDQNDHDTLRDDPVFQLICSRTPGERDCALASQPTLSRFENSISIPDLRRLRDVIHGSRAGSVYAADEWGEVLKLPSSLTSSNRTLMRLEMPDSSMVTPYSTSATVMDRLWCVIMMN